VAIDFVARGQDLELKGIRKEFPGFVAVDNLDLHIPAGEFFALLGPSGCGKTTTLRMIAGLESPTAGKILLGGKDITDMKPHERPVNTVFQNYALFPHMSVLENVAFGIRRRKLDEPLTKAQQALAMVELEHLAQRKPQQLSGGQQQRVALARALVNRTVAVMNQGHIEQMGAPEALYDRPKTAFVAKFLGQSNMFIGKVTESNAETTSIDFNGKKITGLTKRSEKTSGKIAIGVRPEKTYFHETEPKADPALNILGPGEITDIRFTGVHRSFKPVPD
jgi:spermidine/putrescine transport system ATP-binding protein